MLQPTSVTLAITTPTHDPRNRDGLGLRSREQLSFTVAGDGAAHDVAAGREIYDPYEDETPPSYRPPVDPRSWAATPPTTEAPAVRDAVAGMQAALAGIDWSQVTRAPATVTDHDNVALSMRFDARPEGIDHLRPVQTHDGEWYVRVLTSTDLLAQQALAPVVDAARLVLDAARAAAAR